MTVRAIVKEPLPIGVAAIEELLRLALGTSADDALVQRLMRVLYETALEGAQQPAQALGQPVTVNANNPLLQRLAQDHRPKVVGINETTRTALRDRLLAVISEAGSLRDQQRAVREVFAHASSARALTIARTENQIFWHAGGHAQMREFGVVSHTWISSQDNRVRDAHAIAHGQCRPFNEAFDVGGEPLQYPGDPAGSPGNIINCRCTEIPGVTPCGVRSLGADVLANFWFRAIRPIYARERLAWRMMRGIFAEQRSVVLQELARLTGT